MVTPVTYWTVVQNGVEQTFAALSLSKVKLERRSFDVDELSLTCDGQGFDTPDLWAFGTEITVWRNRVTSTPAALTPAPGSFSGGSIYFQGVMSASKRDATGRKEDVTYTISGPWWWLKQDCYEQFIPAIGGYTTHIVLNMNATTGLLWSLATQVGMILDDALTKYGAIFTFDPTGWPEFGGFYAPTDEKRDITHAEALKDDFKWSPRTVSWFDYTQSPPQLHFNSATTLPVTTLNLTDQVTVISADIVPRYDQQIGQVTLRFEQNNQIGNNEVLLLTTDQWPVVATGIPKMRASMNLYGLKGTDQQAKIVTADITVNSGLSSWWISKSPDLAKVTGLVIHDVIYTDPNNEENVITPLQYELQEGSFHAWMNVGNGPTAAAGEELDVHVQALLDYVDENGRIVIDEPHSTKVKTTNLVTGTYTRLHITSFAEPLPVGMAEYFYNLLSFLPWEGEVAVEGDEVSAQQFLGCRLCLTNGLLAWATMNATVFSTTEDVDNGRLTIKFGPNKWLSPEEIIDLLNVTRIRDISFYQSTMVTGSAPNDEVDSPDNTVKENKTHRRGTVNKDIVTYTNPAPDSPTTTVTTDAINNLMTFSTTNPTAGAVSLILADLTTNRGLN